MNSFVVIWNNYLENCHKVRENAEDNFFQKSFWNVIRWMLKNDRIAGLVLISSKSSSSSVSRKTFTEVTLPITAAIFRLIFHLFQRDDRVVMSCDKNEPGHRLELWNKCAHRERERESFTFFCSYSCHLHYWIHSNCSNWSHAKKKNWVINSSCTVGFPRSVITHRVTVYKQINVEHRSRTKLSKSSKRVFTDYRPTI